MEKYKPEYLGKVIPADDQSKLTDFVTNKYDAFSKIYDVCKDQSEHINDISAVDNNSTNSLSVKVSTDSSVMDSIKESTKDDKSVIIDNNVITTSA